MSRAAVRSLQWSVAIALLLSAGVALGGRGSSAAGHRWNSWDDPKFGADGTGAPGVGTSPDRGL